jgi:endonuclease YncB( thermonuclease family)
MPFLVILGTFHLVGQTSAGNATGFEPDGDSIQFRPTDPSLLDRLTQVGRPYRLTRIGSTQLRLEGIDALELHYEGSHQPRPLADQARDFLTSLFGMNPVPFRPPERTQVLPPVPTDAVPGYILSRSLETYGRPVAFAFAGNPPEDVGAQIWLQEPLLRKSVNYVSVAGGHAYPLFYDTLFADLRAVLAAAANSARTSTTGLWNQDRTQSGLDVATQDDLERDGVVFPKLFRRLTSYLEEPHTGLNAFLSWLADTQEKILDLRTTNVTHFDTIVHVEGNKVSLKREPEEIVFISANTTSTTVAPWLRV